MDVLKSLGVDFRLILVQGIGFIILFLILKKFLFGRIMDIIKSREDEIKARYAKSEEEKNESARLKAEYENRIIEIESEAEKKIQTAVKEAKEISQGIIQETRKEAENIKQKAASEIEQQKRKALAEIRNEVVNLSILSASKIMAETIDSRIAEKLVDNAIEEIGGLS
ncbi:MAG: F0F1 ATP synthase subunit B [Nitrospinota bacterium]